MLRFFCATLIVVYALYWGNRSFNTGSDTYNYVFMYKLYLLYGSVGLPEIDSGLIALMKISSALTYNPSTLLTLICIIIGVSYYKSGIFILKNDRYILIYTTLLILSPHYLSININILRHGLSSATAIVIMGIILKYKRNIIKLSTFYIPSLFHKIAGAAVLPMILGTYKSFPLPLWFLLVCISAFSGIYGTTASQLIPSEYNAYLSTNLGYRTGFRPDFVAFSAVPLFLILAVPYRKMSNETRWVFNAYLMMNGFGHLMNFVSYSDRFLTSSWTLLPLLVTLIIKDINERVFRHRDNKRFFSWIIIIGTLAVNSFFYLSGV